MTENEKINRAIHAVVDPGECWHEIDPTKLSEDGGRHYTSPLVHYYVHACSKCDYEVYGKSSWHEANPDYLDPDQPHSQLVRMVRAFVAEFGQLAVTQKLYYTKGPVYLLTIPADQIATALATMVEEYDRSRD